MAEGLLKFNKSIKKLFMNLINSQLCRKIVKFSGIFLKNRLVKSRHPEVFNEKGVLNNFARFTGKDLRWRYFLVQLQAGRSLWVGDNHSVFTVFPFSIVYYVYLSFLMWSIFLKIHSVSYTEGKTSAATNWRQLQNFSYWRGV